MRTSACCTLDAGTMHNGAYSPAVDLRGRVSGSAAAPAGAGAGAAEARALLGAELAAAAGLAADRFMLLRHESHRRTCLPLALRASRQSVPTPHTWRQDHTTTPALRHPVRHSGVPAADVHAITLGRVGVAKRVAARAAVMLCTWQGA